MPPHEWELHRMMTAVRRSIPLDPAVCDEALFPAHLPVAVIDAAFGLPVHKDEKATAVSARYCDHFGVARVRTDRWNFPPVEAQESLDEFVRHYDEIGMRGMSGLVFRTRTRLPGTDVTRGEFALRLANGLRRSGIEVLQHMQSMGPDAVAHALQTLPGTDELVVSRLLHFTGEDRFVWADGCRAFVGAAIGQGAVSAARTTQLVRRTGDELIVSPRFLSYEIWKSAGPSMPSALEN